MHSKTERPKRRHSGALGLAPVLAAIAIAAAGCGSSSKSSDNGGVVTPPATTSSGAPTGGAAASATKVQISNFKYVPPAITVKTGGTVTWTNGDSAPHTATAKANSAFDTGTLNQGQSKTVTFSRAGTFQYTCLFHPFMRGAIVVK
jgi:amicyanin